MTAQPAGVRGATPRPRGLTKLLPLLFLYFSEGLPFGFQATALPLMLRERGVSLQAIGAAGLLAAPWLGKALWAPFVDRYGSERFGRRKSWIVPMQAALAACAFLAARADRPVELFVLVFLMNLFAATLDIAVDALAVSWLDEDELGPGNALQVVGYKLGMLTGGGLLVWASGMLGWNGLFNAMGALLLGVLAMSIWMREHPNSAQPEQAPDARVSFGELGARLRGAWQQPSAAALISVVMTYKLGETLADAMWKPMLFDRGFAPSEIGLWNGTFGMLCSLLGTIASGQLVRKCSLASALAWIAVFRAGGVAGLWWASVLSQPSAATIIAATCVEHVFAGAITTVLFALMMHHSDRAIGGTHYTLLASLEVWGKAPIGALSGLIASALGYPALFGIATALCIAFALWVRVVRTRLIT
jgi:MFS transporter, PAT family, beta-lactamase induction signal transducer AmpG